MDWSRNKEVYEKYKGLRVSIANCEPGYIIGYNTKNSISILMKVKDNGLFSGEDILEQPELKRKDYFIDQEIDLVGRYTFGHFDKFRDIPPIKVFYEKNELKTLIEKLEL